jgi:hypothetical protein
MVDLFFQGRDPVHKSLKRIVKRLVKAKISYALVGGMAVNSHGHQRTTNDVDLLLTAEGLAELRRRFVPKYYEEVPRRPRRLIDRNNQVAIDFLVTGLFPGSGKPGPIVYPDPASVRTTLGDYEVVNLITLVQLKLAARRYQDFADVVELIRVYDLDESFGNQLHSSLQRDYIECLEEKRREDEYEARQD